MAAYRGTQPPGGGPGGTAGPVYNHETARLRDHREQVGYLTFSPDSALLASSAWDNTVRLWQVAQPQQAAAVLEGMKDAVADVAFSPDGALLATSADEGRVRVWTRLGKPVATLESGGTDTRSVLFSPDGRHLAASFGSAEVVVWSAQGALVARLGGHRGGITDIAFAPDGQLLVSGDAAGTVRLWDTRGWHLASAFQGIPPAVGAAGAATQSPGQSLWVGAFAWSPDSRRLALRGRSAQGAVQVWELPANAEQGAGGAGAGWTPRWVGAVIAPRHIPIVVLFSPNGRLLLVADQDDSKLPVRDRVNTVRMLDAQTLAEVGQLPVPDDYASRLVFSPDGRFVAVGGAAGMVWLWEVTTRQLVAAIAAHTESWDYRVGAPLYALGALAWSPDGRWLATAGLDPLDPAHARWPEGEPQFTIKLWRLADLQGVFAQGGAASV